MCRSKGKCLIKTCPTTSTFHLSLSHFLITLCTCVSLPHPTITHFSQCNCGHTINDLGTYLFQRPCESECITAHDMIKDIIVVICLGEWSTCLEGGLPPFPSPHPMTNGYPYHLKQLPNLDGRHYYQPNSDKYGVANIDDDNTCNDDGYFGEDMIIH